jgi:hypothetical protein
MSLSLVAAAAPPESFPFKPVAQVEEPITTVAPSAASVDSAADLNLDLQQLHRWMLLVILMWLNPLFLVIFSHLLQLLRLGPPMIMHLPRLPCM